jgi:hypothetical protein
MGARLVAEWHSYKVAELESEEMNSGRSRSYND